MRTFCSKYGNIFILYDLLGDTSKHLSIIEMLGYVHLSVVYHKQFTNSKKAEPFEIELYIQSPLKTQAS